MKFTTTLAGALVASASWAGMATAQQDISMWYHGAGGEVENALVTQVVNDFNASQSDYKVTLESFPQASYNDSVVAAALAGNLPDIIDVDGPVMPGPRCTNHTCAEHVCGLSKHHVLSANMPCETCLAVQDKIAANKQS